MASKTEYFSGIAYWTKYKTMDEKYGHYNLQLYVDKETQRKIKASGLKLTPKLNEDNEVYFTFRRPHKKMFKEEEVIFGPIKAYYGQNEDGTAKEFNDHIGNGSKVTIKVTVYDAGDTKGHRTEAIRVDELVEYNPTPKEETFNMGIPF